MSKSSGRTKPNFPNFANQIQTPAKPKPTSLLEKMVDGREYESVIGLQNISVEFGPEVTLALRDISRIRKRPIVCYAANVLNSSIKTSTSIDYRDEKPFFEMLSNIPAEYKDLDIVLVTPGGSAEIVANIVDRARQRFDNVGFILPYMAMSAGTIFCLSGDELIMDQHAYIGPIDPQVPSSKAGRFVPAQSILTLIAAIQSRGQQQMAKGESPLWTDIELLRNLDPKEIGNAYNASQFSISLVSQYLEKYKFKFWQEHSDGRPVTQQDKVKRASEIANQLCNHSLWLSHSRGISRDVISGQLRLKVQNPEDTEGLSRAIKRFWALMCFAFESTPIVKVFASDNYLLFRHEFAGVEGGHQ